MKYYAELLSIENIGFDPKSPAKLVCRIEEECGRVSDKKLKERVWPQYSLEYAALAYSPDADEYTSDDPEEIKRARKAEKQHIQNTQCRDCYLVSQFFKTLREGGDYDQFLDTLLRLLQTPEQFIYVSE